MTRVVSKNPVLGMPYNEKGNMTTKWFYIRDEKNKPVACVASVSKASPLDPFKQEWSIGVSVCNPTDQFRKKDAIRIAVGRAEKNPLAIMTNKDGMNAKLMAEIASGEFLPWTNKGAKRVVAAARRWVDTPKKTREVLNFWFSPTTAKHDNNHVTAIINGYRRAYTECSDNPVPFFDYPDNVFLGQGYRDTIRLEKV